MSEQFDKAYYDRFYRNPDTRAVTPAAVRRQARFIAAYLDHLEVPVRQILDIGCGTGGLLRALAKALPKANVRGVEYSSYLCEAYGWQQGSVVDVNVDPADLVVCNDVLGYLNDADCALALKNLARHSRLALYLGVLTREDLTLCDPDRTDQAQSARPVAWYQRRLSHDFLPVGGGLFLRKPVDVTVWHLERG
ncbi:MAG: class I SAM-dependent methyltransferase [Gammaproteobacteria bacterium]|jgi:SAM-dependent methyltransferase|nr:MAG: class I SAM-dependent methyltransferase [Gammaproteobacteria bacterium]